MSGTINRFRPNDVTPEVWRRVGDVVRLAVTQSAPGTVTGATKELSAVTQFALWADRLGLSLDLEVLFHPETIDRFIVDGCPQLKDGTRLNYRSHLWKVGAALLGPKLFPPRTLPLQRTEVSAPYSTSEVTELVSWSRGLTTHHMRRNSAALLAVGLGAGLKGQEMTGLVGSDVRMVDDLVVIDVNGRRSRRVPVLSQWAPAVLELASEAQGRPFFMPGSRRATVRDISSFLNRCSGDEPAAFSVQRLRITWIVWHLSAGTPLWALEKAAGARAAQLVKYLMFARSPDEATAYRLLAGARSP